MFGSLKNIVSSGWLDNKQNYVIRLSTEYENTMWQVFSVYHIPTTNDYLKINFKTNTEWNNFTKKLIKRSYHNFDTDVNTNDNILTLSTCWDKKEKVVLHAKYDLRPGMGMAAIQLGIDKRYFVVVHEQEKKETFKNYIIINPKIVSTSEEMIYVEEGEGCLSVNRDIEGIVPRHARVTLEGYDMEGNKIKLRGREELAVAFQHELDHLNGILFTDKIDKKNPYKYEDIYRPI